MQNDALEYLKAGVGTTVCWTSAEAYTNRIARVEAPTAPTLEVVRLNALVRTSRATGTCWRSALMVSQEPTWWSLRGHLRDFAAGPTCGRLRGVCPRWFSALLDQEEFVSCWLGIRQRRRPGMVRRAATTWCEAQRREDAKGAHL